MVGAAAREEFLRLGQIIGYQLQQSDYFSYRDGKGDSLLHVALRNGFNKCAEEILAYAPLLIHAENNEKHSPIFVAHESGNLDGVKLCLEYHPIQGSPENNCPDIYDTVKGSVPYYLSPENMVRCYIPESGKNIDKLVIIIDTTDLHVLTGPFHTEDFSSSLTGPWGHFKESQVPIMKIGNNRQSLSFNYIKEQLAKAELPEKILVIIHSHGMVDKNGSHTIMFDNTDYQKYTKDLFAALKEVFADKPIDVLLESCHGGAALQDVHFLPLGSKLLTLAKPEHITSVYEGSQIFKSPIDYDAHPEEFSTGTLMLRYLSILHQTNNVPGVAVSGGEAYFLDTLTKCLGKPIGLEQRKALLEKLAKYCTDCEDRIKDTLNKITVAKNIKEFLAPQTLLGSSIDETIERFASNADLTEAPCHVRLEEALSPEFSLYLHESTSSTDYSICQNEEGRVYDLSESLQAQRVLIEPELPVFGIAMAILYELESSGACFTDSGGYAHAEL